MTETEAKALALEVWEYLRDHPELESKSQLPEKLHRKIERHRNCCPLCSIFWEPVPPCPRCPLYQCSYGSFYVRWGIARDEEARRRAAAKIVECLKAWKPEAGR